MTESERQVLEDLAAALNSLTDAMHEVLPRIVEEPAFRSHLSQVMAEALFLFSKGGPVLPDVERRYKA
jgi:hypothetical protein